MKIMLPKESDQLKKLKARTFFLLDQFHVQGSRSMHRMNQKFSDNFKELAIKSKKNDQQFVEMWGEISASFSGPTKKKSIIPSSIMEHPDDMQGQELYDD